MLLATAKIAVKQLILFKYIWFSCSDLFGDAGFVVEGEFKKVFI